MSIYQLLNLNLRYNKRETDMKKTWLYVIIAASVFFITVSSLIFIIISNFNDLSNNEINLTSAEKNWLASNYNNITITVDPDYPPASFINKDDNFRGVTADFIELIEKKINIKFRLIRAKTWTEALGNAKKGVVDVIGSVAFTPERKEFLIFTQNYTESPAVIIVNRNEKNINSFKDLSGRRVVCGESYAISSYINEVAPDIVTVPVRNDLEALRLVSERKAEAAATDLSSATYFINKTGISNLKVAFDTGFVYFLSFGINRNKPILAGIIIKAMNSITIEEREKIFSRWINLDYQPFFLNRKFWLSIILSASIILVVTVCFILWNRSLSGKVERRTVELNSYKDKLEALVEERTAELSRKNDELIYSLEQIKTLRGMIPICSRCKKIRDDEGFWQQIEQYIEMHSDVEFSHGLCPTCVSELYGNEDWFKKMKC